MNKDLLLVRLPFGWFIVSSRWFLFEVFGVGELELHHPLGDSLLQMHRILSVWASLLQVSHRNASWRTLTPVLSMLVSMVVRLSGLSGSFVALSPWRHVIFRLSSIWRLYHLIQLNEEFLYFVPHICSFSRKWWKLRFQMVVRLLWHSVVQVSWGCLPRQYSQIQSIDELGLIIPVAKGPRVRVGWEHALLPVWADQLVWPLALLDRCSPLHLCHLFLQASHRYLHGIVFSLQLHYVSAHIFVIRRHRVDPGRCFWSRVLLCWFSL